eukprot:5035563-Prymnesium_polylepis.1
MGAAGVCACACASCSCGPVGPRVTSQIEKVVEEEEYGAARSAQTRARYARSVRARHARGAG